MIFNKLKFKEMILYFSNKCVDDPHFGVIKLNKLLFLSDFYSYANTLNSISGATYIHLEKGPAPKEMIRVREEMVPSDINFGEKKVPGGFPVYKTTATRQAVISVFSPEEVAQMDRAIKELKRFNAEDASDLTHKWEGWKLTRPYEPIPYDMVFVRELRPVTDKHIRWAKRRMSKISA